MAQGVVNPTMEVNPYYQTVPASVTATALGPGAGAAGDFLNRIVVVPGTTAPGSVILIDATASATIFTGGAGNPLTPTTIVLNAFSKNGAWKISTGANVTLWVTGAFSV